MNRNPDVATTSPILKGWMPIVGAFSVWFAHFMIAWSVASIWPRQPIANLVTLVITLPALAALAILFMRLRASQAASDHAAFVRQLGLGSVFIAVVATLFDALPALVG